MDPRLQQLGLDEYTTFQSPRSYPSQYYDSTSGQLDANSQFVQDGGYFQNVPQDELRRHTIDNNDQSQQQQQIQGHASRHASLPTVNPNKHVGNSAPANGVQRGFSAVNPFRASLALMDTTRQSSNNNPYNIGAAIRLNSPQSANSTTGFDTSGTTSPISKLSLNNALPTPPSDPGNAQATHNQNIHISSGSTGAFPSARVVEYPSSTANTVNNAAYSTYNIPNQSSSHSHHNFGASPREQPTTTSPSKAPSQPEPLSLSTLTEFHPPSASGHLVPNPPNLASWRTKLFNITTPLLLSSEEYHTYFPHIDNVYSHRSTQRYKRKPFVSHYWDCRLKGRPTGTPLGKKKGEADEEGNKKKRKRKVRERDLCDVKIKVTEFFGKEELEALGRAGGVEGSSVGNEDNGSRELMFVLEDQRSRQNHGQNSNDAEAPFGVLEPAQNFPPGHPGEGGKRWYMIQRVSGNEKNEEGDEGGQGVDLDHKHTLEESDRIKKNSVQRMLLAMEKEKKREAKARGPDTHMTDSNNQSPNPTASATGQPAPPPPAPISRFHVTGAAATTAKIHSHPASSRMTFFANSFCPFAQRVWIALELIGIPYQYIEVTEYDMNSGRCTIPELVEVNPEGVIPCIRHGNFGVWESNVIMEYLEDLAMGHSLFPVGDPQLKAHSRLWTDHINRKILPSFYSLLLTPQGDDEGGDWRYQSGIPPLTERRMMLVATLQESITKLVNASHRSGPFFLGDQVSYVDVVFAPWIIRLSRVLSYYREFPRPEVGTRWQKWVDAIERHPGIQNTVSEDRSYHDVYGGVGEDGFDGTVDGRKMFAEIYYAKSMVRSEGFGLGGDVWGHIRQPAGVCEG